MTAFEIVYILFNALVLLPGQILLFVKVKPVVLRLIPLFVCILASVALFASMYIAPSYGEGWESLGFALAHILLFLFALISVGVCAVGILAGGIIRSVRTKKQRRAAAMAQEKAE